MRTTRFVRLLGVVALVPLAAAPIGCKRPPIATVEGTVTLDGRPVDGGVIRFEPADGASQTADSVITGGRYSVTMPPGDKKVQVYWARTEGVAGDTAKQGTERAVQLIPQRYRDAQTTLAYTLVDGPQVKDFALTTR